MTAQIDFKQKMKEIAEHLDNWTLQDEYGHEGKLLPDWLQLTNDYMRISIRFEPYGLKKNQARLSGKIVKVINGTSFESPSIADANVTLTRSTKAIANGIRTRIIAEMEAEYPKLHKQWLDKLAKEDEKTAQLSKWVTWANGEAIANNRHTVYVGTPHVYSTSPAKTHYEAKNQMRIENSYPTGTTVILERLDEDLAESVIRLVELRQRVGREEAEEERKQTGYSKSDPIYDYSERENNANQ